MARLNPCVTLVEHSGVLVLIMMESSGVNCFFTVMKKEGMVGMYKGVIPEMFRGIGGPLVLTAYDRIKLWMGA